MVPLFLRKLQNYFASSLPWKKHSILLTPQLMLTKVGGGSKANLVKEEQDI